MHEATTPNLNFAEVAVLKRRLQQQRLTLNRRLRGIVNTQALLLRKVTGIAEAREELKRVRQGLRAAGVQLDFDPLEDQGVAPDSLEQFLLKGTP